jgi:23S rRNA U2552 (ribose-2'-O)-methylase RlmE/FtsJ
MQIYHPGKVVEVFSPNGKDVFSDDAKVQATVEMWDENILTLNVAQNIAKEIKRDDVVLVDYSPISQKILAPKTIIVKILRGEKAEKIWKIYKQLYEKRKKQPLTQPPPIRPEYVG